MSELLCINIKPWVKICCEAGDFLQDSCKLLGTLTTTSRLKYKPDAFKFKLDVEPLSEVVDYKPKLRTFESICNQRAVDLLARAREENRKLRVMYSGGIDSTLALISLLKMAQKSEIENIDVILTTTSIDENKSFYFNHICGKFKTINAITNHYDTYFDKSIVITGELGDQLFGSDIVRKVLVAVGDFEIIKTDPDFYSILIKTFTPRIGGVAAKKFVSHFMPIVEECPFKIKNTFDFLFFWNFSQKFQNVKYRELTNSSPGKLKYNRKYLSHFYDTLEFQRWALDNQESGIKMPGNLESYKDPAKKIICDFTKDYSYMIKKKYGSQAAISYYRESLKEHSAITKFYNLTNSVHKYVVQGFKYGT